MKRINLTLSLLAICSITIQSQTKKEFREELLLAIKQKRQNQACNDNFDKYCIKFPEYVMQETTSYLSDSTGSVRFLSIRVISQVVKLNKDKLIRQKGVYHLLNTDVNSLHTSARQLEQFTKDDFSGASKDTIRAFMQSQQRRVDEIIMLVGYLDMYDQIPVLRKLLDKPEELGAKELWKIKCALARMGDLNEISYCIEFAKKEACSMQAIYQIFPDLIYTRQKAVFDYLVGVMQNDKMLALSANPASQKKIACGYRIMELFPGIVENFPLKLEQPNIKQIATDDYKKALQTARKWFIDNPDYKIKKDSF